MAETQKHSPDPYLYKLFFPKNHLLEMIDDFSAGPTQTMKKIKEFDRLSKTTNMSSNIDLNPTFVKLKTQLEAFNAYKKIAEEFHTGNGTISVRAYTEVWLAFFQEHLTFYPKKNKEFLGDI